MHRLALRIQEVTDTFEDPAQVLRLSACESSSRRRRSIPAGSNCSIVPEGDRGRDVPIHGAVCGPGPGKRHAAGRFKADRRDPELETRDLCDRRRQPRDHEGRDGRRRDRARQSFGCFASPASTSIKPANSRRRAGRRCPTNEGTRALTSDATLAPLDFASSYRQFRAPSGGVASRSHALLFEFRNAGGRHRRPHRRVAGARGQGRLAGARRGTRQARGQVRQDARRPLRRADALAEDPGRARARAGRISPITSRA